MGIPVVTIFVRHSKNCPYIGDEFNKRCRCAKHLRWSHDGKQHRHTAKANTWSDAEEAKKKVEAAYELAALPGKQKEGSAKLIADAVELFISDRQGQGLDPVVIKKYVRELSRFKTFMEKRAKLFVADVSAEDCSTYRGTWKTIYPSSTTRANVQGRLLSFLKFCYDNLWLNRVPPMSSITVTEPPTMPLEPQEYEKLLAQCAVEFPSEKAKKVHALIRTMRHTGLAIRDTVTLERSEIVWDSKKRLHRVVTSRQKTGVHVSVPIPPDVAAEILAVLKGNPRYVFWSTGTGLETSAVANWQHDLRKVFKGAGVHIEGQLSHRLRDTFAVEFLKAGLPIESVAKMLGNTIKICEKHYAKWVIGRQNLLDEQVVATFK